jgi:glycosyltransferase involved in cell wall biosynthesis
MKISYAITVCNEKKEVKRLVDFLLYYKRPNDEIVILYDQKNGDEGVIRMLTKLNKLPNFQVWRGFFDDNFAAWKNKLIEYCTGDYIFQIDADEIPNKVLIKHLPEILQANPDNEVYLVPRVNTVEGLTEAHVRQWKWNVNESGWINWPDYQWRVWKNKPNIFWKNKVHEKLDGFKTYSLLPAQEELALYHPKDIERQEKQNAYYDTL